MRAEPELNKKKLSASLKRKMVVSLESWGQECISDENNAWGTGISNVEMNKIVCSKDASDGTCEAELIIFSTNGPTTAGRRMLRLPLAIRHCNIETGSLNPRKPPVIIGPDCVWLF